MHVISYISSSTVEASAVKSELMNIVEVAQNRNAANGVTGVLFYTNDYFFQTIEGRESDLRTIYDDIVKDERHQDIKKLLDEPSGERTISDWSLDTFYVDNPELINPKTISLLQSLYTTNYGVSPNGLIEFVKKMIDEMDTFKILQNPYFR